MTAPQTGAKPSRIHSWLAARTPLQRHGIAFLAGACATLAHAPFQLTLFFVAAVVALVWLLDVAATQHRRVRSAFATGWSFGVGHFVTGVYWVAYAFQVDSQAWGPIWGVPATLALAAGLALFWGLGAALAMLFWTRDLRQLAAFTICIFTSK